MKFYRFFCLSFILPIFFCSYNVGFAKPLDNTNDLSDYCNSKKILKLVEKGDAAHKKMDSKTLEKIGKAILEIDTACYQGYLMLAYASEAKNEMKSAVELYTKALQRNKSDLYIRIYRADCNKVSNEYKNAIEDYSYVLQNMPADNKQVKGILYYLRGQCKYELNNNEEALVDYKMSINYFPGFSSPHYYTGLSLYNLKKYNEAIQSFSTFLNINEKEKLNISGAFLFRGLCYLDIKDNDNAIQDFNMVINNNERMGQAYWNLGAAYQNKKDYKKSTTEYNYALEYYKNDSTSLCQLYNNIGFNAIKNENYDEALLNFNKAIAFDKTNFDPYDNRVDIDIKKKDYSKAVNGYRALLEIFKDSSNRASIYNNIGYCYSKMKLYDKVITTGDTALKYNPKSLYAWATIGYGYLYTKRYDKAREFFDKSLALDTTHDYSYYNLACYYILTGNKPEWIKWLNLAFIHGFDQFKYLEEDSDLEAVRNDEDFKKMVAKYKK